MIDLPKLEVDGTVSRVASLLRDEILKGSLAPGTQMVVATLADQLGTSKGSVREAIRELVSEGLLEHHLHRGTFVREFSAEECADLYLSRSVIEVWAAERILVEKPTNFEALESAVDRMASSDSATEIIDADMDFHRALVELAGSPRMTELHQALIAETTVMARARRPFDAQDHHPIHRVLLEALRDGNDHAPKLLEAHLNDAKNRMLQRP